MWQGKSCTGTTGSKRCEAGIWFISSCPGRSLKEIKSEFAYDFVQLMQEPSDGERREEENAGDFVFGQNRGTDSESFTGELGDSRIKQ